VPSGVIGLNRKPDSSAGRASSAANQHYLPSPCESGGRNWAKPTGACLGTTPRPGIGGPERPGGNSTTYFRHAIDQTPSKIEDQKGLEDTGQRLS